MDTFLPRILIAALVVSTPAAALAAESTPEAMAKSSALYRQARDLQVHGKWAQAEAAYQAAWDLRRTFDIAGNLGDCELHVGQPREAAEHVAYALRNLPAGVQPEQTAALNRMLAEAKTKIGTLRIMPSVPGAQVFVDGRAVEGSGDEIFVDPGTRTIEARRDGYDPATRTLNVRAGTKQSVGLDLTPRRSIVPGVVLGSVAGAALVTGIGLFAAGRAKASSAQSTSDAISRAGHSCVAGASNYDAGCADLQSTASASNTLQRAGVGLWIGAAAAAAATVLYFTLPTASPGKRSTGALTIAPLLSPAAGGLVVSGTL